MTTTDSSSARSRPKSHVAIAVVIGLAAATVAGSLGWWQWERAHAQSHVVTAAPPVPIQEATQPGGSATGMGQSVVVEGEWAQQPVLWIPGREVDGVPATLLVRPFTVAADATGTGEVATLAVVAGWVPAGSETPGIVPRAGDASTVTIRGYVRGSEAPGSDPWPTDAPEGVLWVPALSTALFAQVWPAPVYSAIVVDDEPAPGWSELPLPPAETSLDIRSLTYAFEWWLFGAFAVFVVVRWIRDGAGYGRMAATPHDDPRRRISHDQ